jgi:hypothetical protein
VEAGGERRAQEDQREPIRLCASMIIKSSSVRQASFLIFGFKWLCHLFACESVYVTRECVSVCAYVCVYICVCMLVCACMCVFQCMCVCVCVCACVCVCVYLTAPDTVCPSDR